MNNFWSHYILMYNSHYKQAINKPLIETFSLIN